MNEDLKLDIAEAVQILKDGGIILYPTDTIWGLGCDATNKEAVERIFEIKQRSDSKSLITLVSDADMLGRYVKKIPEMAISLIEVNDKPMTIIYPDGISLAENVLASDKSVGIRVVNHEFCQQLIKKLGRAIVSTSANISGEETPSSFEEINVEILNAVDWIADPIYEEDATGEPSQIIKVDLDGGIQILRN